jgi:hypothetical protein
MTTEVKVTLGHDLVLPHLSAVNTFHFGQPGDAKPALPGAPAAAFRDFYNVTAATAVNPVGRYISDEISRLPLSSKVELYDLEDPLPRLPYHTLLFALTAAGSGVDYPGEVAVVASWTTAEDPAVPVRRRRGRTFIGPLKAFSGLLQTGIVRPSPTMRDDVAKSAFALLDTITEGLVVYSRTSVPKIATLITGGYIDDAFDTMRSRGSDTTLRRVF